jgi:large subunit ribosomal protein L22
MEVIAKGKFIRISAKKARPVADLIRGKNAKVSLAALKLMPQRTSNEIAKVLLSAMSNAENNFNLDKDALLISKITVDAGPSLKRWRPRAKGATSSIKKRTAHITVIVSGEIKSKKAAEKIDTSKDSASKEDHKIDVEKPEFMKREKNAPKVDLKSNFFRRKTG